ncbi:BON domain-containing protein [Desulfovibrio sp. OttesenSCG-928-G15]|nr:BON domain-containing protein [Desulfovibrio sp. OttesenSCG-928-G15]
MHSSIRTSLCSFFCLCLLVFGSACAKVDPGASGADRGMRFDDAGIKTDITAALLKMNATKSNDINVRCYRGHVFLIGEADEQFREKALDEARRTPEVVHVTTHWFPTGTANPVLDASVEDAIDKGGIIGPGNHPRVVTVDSWGGHVVLTGLSRSKSNVDAAIAKIKTIPQVKSVTSYIDVREEEGGRK